MRKKQSLSRLLSFLIVAVLSLVSFGTNAQTLFAKYGSLFNAPKNYIVSHTSIAPLIDGNINDQVWEKATWTNDFEDIEGDLKPRPALKTNVKMLWDDSCLYIAARISDPNVWANLKQHDDIIFQDNDFEVFVDPDNTTHRYFEIEYNAFNTVFDLFMNKPYRNGGNALINWDVKGLRSAVNVQGSINDPADKDTGWTLEMAIPFKALAFFSHGQIPTENTLWRINFSRVEWDTKATAGKYVKLKDSTGRIRPEHNWVWSPQGVVNMHYPERWGYLLFTRGEVNLKDFRLPYAELQKRYLWLVYYQQADKLKQNGRFDPSLQKLGVNNKVTIDGRVNTLTMEATSLQFMVFIADEKDHLIRTINQDGLVGIINEDK